MNDYLDKNWAAAGFEKGRLYERSRQYRIAWFKLFCLVILACFAAHFIWALIATLV